MTRLLYIGTSLDAPYLSFLKGCTSGVATSVITKPVDTLTQIDLICKRDSISGVFTSSVDILKKLLSWTDNRKDPSLQSYAGSLFKRGGLEYLVIEPLSQLTAVPYAKFTYTRHISKLATPSNWLPTTTFDYSLLDVSNIESTYEAFQRAYAIAVDIETFSKPLSIRCIGYTAIYIAPDRSISSKSVVLPLDSMWAVMWMRKFNNLPAAKIFQNGKYDNAYLSMFNSVPYNWLWDTAHLMHSWYSELPKDLAFLNAFFVRESMYWKDMADTNDLSVYYEYNARDTWATANVWIAQMLQMPEWARQNYLMEFPLVFPCHMSEMTGIKRDMERLESSRNKLASEIEIENNKLSTMVATPNFNVNSYIQVRQMLKVVTGKDHTESDEKYLKKMALQHPLTARLCNKILDIRGNRKLKSTYLRTDSDITKTNPVGYKEYKGRVLYALNPHGTDTGRLASRESHFWCGLQIQNIPRGDAVKSTLVADDGFLIGECDYAQIESRYTGYLAGEETLIAAVTSDKDFHALNASAFFGIPYDQIYDDVKHKTIDKKLRDLSKRTNHGANYLMGWSVMIDTMGEDKVWEAKRLLKLPTSYGLRQVTEHLLSQFHKTYSKLSSQFYPKVQYDVDTTHMLIGAQGWTRYCFGHPSKNKQDLNMYVAHRPQSENAMGLNKAYLRVFYTIALHPEWGKNFKLCAQVHDSILFQVRVGWEWLAEEVKKCMECYVDIVGVDGIKRTMFCPADLKALGKYWSDCDA